MSGAREHGYPHGSVFYRNLQVVLPRIVRAQGCCLWDESGKRYLDACGGAFAANLGHGLSEIADAIAQQARSVAYVNGTAFTNGPCEELAGEIAALAPPGLDKVLFLSSGSEAVEAALKLARQYWIESGHPEKRTIIARTPGYHGNTLLALSASGRPHAKDLFEPWIVRVSMIPAPDPYRCACAGRADCPVCSGSALEEAILREGAGTVAAFIAEPIGGATSGAVVPRADHYARIRAICDRHGVLFIADEVLTGAGRTGKFLAIEHYGVAPDIVTPDIVTMGKGLSGGYAALSAVIASRRILDPIAEGSGVFKHAQTFSNAPLACAAGLAAMRYLRAHDLVARSAEMGRVLQAKLCALLRHPNVGDVRGLGLLAAVELVADTQTKRPFARSLRVAESIRQKARDLGLVVWSNVGHVAGPHAGQADDAGDILLIAPPFVIREPEIDEIVELLEAALAHVLPATGAPEPTALPRAAHGRSPPRS